MFNKKLLAASMAAAISTGMVAQTNAMQLQETDIGQVLMAPTYMTSGELRSDITVVNTRTDAAVKAKIVFRNGKDSAEVLDFILYLTPGDVWRGSVTGEANAAFIESTDDSMTNDDGSFASEDNPVKQAFFDKSNSGQNGIGHFEVYGLYSVDAGSYTPNDASGAALAAVTVEATMLKTDLKAIFDSVTTEGGPGVDTVPGFELTNSDKPTSLQIMGEVQLVNAANGLISYNIPALGPHFYVLPCDSEDFVNNCAVSSDNFDGTVGAPTDMGQGMGLDGDDNIIAIETAIAAKNISFPYSVEDSNVSIPVVAFVTKYRHLTNVCGGPTSAVSGEYHPPFEPTIIGEVIISTRSFDNLENSKVASSSEFSGDDSVDPVNSLPLEVNFMTDISYFSTSGWTNIGYSNVEPGCPYEGAPELSAVLKTEGAGLYWNETGDRRQGM